MVGQSPTLALLLSQLCLLLMAGGKDLSAHQEQLQPGCPASSISQPH